MIEKQQISADLGSHLGVPAWNPGGFVEGERVSSDVLDLESLRLYTVEEAAKVLHLTPATIRAYCQTGKMVYRIRRFFRGYYVRRQIIFTNDDLKQYLEKKHRLTSRA